MKNRKVFDAKNEWQCKIDSNCLTKTLNYSTFIWNGIKQSIKALCFFGLKHRSTTINI